MWVMNNLNIFRQCICSDPGIHVGEKIYPINYDFLVKDSKYLGREKIGIEYIVVHEEDSSEPGEAGRKGKDGKVFLVDHWIKGPHHLWVDVATGR